MFQTLLRRHRLAAALEWLRHSLEISRQLDDTEGVARGLVELGVLWIDTVELDRAADAFEEAIVLATAVDAQPVVARARLALGQVHLDRTDYEPAIRLLRGAQLALHARGDPTGEAAALLQLAMAYLETCLHCNATPSRWR